jgi:tetratricopeptide (TPR) repeat protein
MGPSMQTKLSILCDKIIEAGWLAAAIVVPLFFNVNSSRVFEPDKLSLMRSIALVMVAAWLVKSVEAFAAGPRGARSEERSGARAFLRTPLVIPTLLLVAVYLLTTITSVIPRISFWGSYPRLQGTYTFICYVVIFLLMLNTLRSRQQLERLLTVIIAASFPIALYGIIQHFQLDPLPWGGDVTARVASNMGNAIFVAAYLIMVAPVTIGRFIINLQTFEEPHAPREGDARDVPGPLWTVACVLLFALQALCLTYIFGYQLFFLSDVGHVAGGSSYIALLVSSILASASMALFSVLIFGRLRLPSALHMASRVALFAGQSLALSYFLLLIFRLNYVVLTGTVAAEFVALGALMLLFVVSFWFTFREEGIGSHLLGVLYGFVLSIQLICIFFTRSRGPWIGLLVGLFVFVFIYAVRRRMTWLWVGAAGAAVAGMLFLAVLNVPDSPLAPLREIPYVGRLGQILETETGTGKVRVLIWEGVIDLITPHEPVGLPPDQLDGLNALRPLVGYGPESMFVAYNRFYPPDLAHYEARNASPDRAHNETFDALAMTGWIGFITYMILFGSLFYYGLKWLGAAIDRRQRTIYIAMWILGGGLFALGARFIDGTWRFSGVALAVGITLGFLAYLVIHALVLRGKDRVDDVPLRDQVLLIALFSAIVAHFIEIHFGIAIAATRTYFWIYCALLVIVGLSLWEHPATEIGAQQEAPRPQVEAGRSRRSRRRRRPRGQGRRFAPLEPLWRGIGDLASLSLLMGLVMVTLGYDHITGVLEVSAGGYSVPWLLVLTWLAGGAIIMFEWRRGVAQDSQSGIVQPLLVYVVVSLGIFATFTAIHYSIVSYEPEIRSVDDLVTYSRLLSNAVVFYYAVVFTIMLLVALALAAGRARLAPRLARWPSAVAVPVLLVGAIVLVFSTNVNLVKADTHYKQGLNWDENQQWDASIALYKESMLLAPEQDWYYLFMARALLEKAQSISDDEGRVSFEPQALDDFLRLSPQEVASLDRDSLFLSAFVVLTKAKDINHLNTDHSANLGRVFRVWAEGSTDPQQFEQRWEQSVSYYEDATTLSPHNAQLFNEWGMVYLMAGKYDEAITKFRESLALDAEFLQTYLVLGDTYAVAGDTDGATEAYEKALDLDPNQVKPHLQLCAFYGQQGKLEQAVERCRKAIQLSPNNYQAHRNLALVYRDLGRIDDALTEAKIARELASEEEKPAWDGIISQLEAMVQ